MEAAGKPPGSSTFAAAIVPVSSTLRANREDFPQRPYSLEAMWRRNPLQYNPLLDGNTRTYLTAPAVVQHLIRQGFLAEVKKIQTTTDVRTYKTALTLDAIF